MKPQQSLTDVDLLRAFQDAKVRERDAAGGNGAAKMLRMLSDSVRRLQNLGADVSVTAIAGAQSSAYDLVYATSGLPEKGATTVSYYGTIRSGEASYLYAVATQYDNQPVERVYLSKSNASKDAPRLYSKDSGTLRPKGDAAIYDFAEDERALQKLQSRLVAIAAENAVLMEFDSGEVFNQPAAAMRLPAKGPGLPRLP